MSEQRSRDIANRKLALKLVWIVVGAVVFALALVPLYNVLCKTTGFNGKPEGLPASVAKSLKVDTTRWVKVEFTGNTMSGLAWDFYPKQNSMQVHPGQIEMASYFAKNMTNQPVTGQAVPSLSPGQSAMYFKKIECFCFQQQKLQPGETKEMPLRFYVSPELPENIQTITLSYSFFKAVK